jgi:dTDP-glucose 4,6-dehydratase
MKKVLLTGISGFAGSHIFEHILVNTDWKVIGVASWKHKGTPERIEEVLKRDPSYKDRVEIITHDLTAPFPERTKKRIGVCDYILHVASESHVDRSIDDPVPFIQNNVNINLTMLEFAREYPCKKFLQFSTDEVYGVAPEGVDHKEWATILPSNPYSASKAAQESITISYWRTYGIPLIITNTMNLVGEFQDPEKYTAQLVRKINNGEVVTVHGSKDYVGKRHYLHARNMADALLFIVNNVTPTMFDDEDHTRPEKFNIVGDIELDNLQLAQMVSEIMGKELKYELVDFHATRPGHDRRYSLDGDKLREAGWLAPYDFRESLTKYINWTLSNPLWL